MNFQRPREFPGLEKWSRLRTFGDGKAGGHWLADFGASFFTGQPQLGNLPWFLSALLSPIVHYYPLLSIVIHYRPLLTTMNHYYSLSTNVNHHLSLIIHFLTGKHQLDQLGLAHLSCAAQGWKSSFQRPIECSIERSLEQGDGGPRSVAG